MNNGYDMQRRGAPQVAQETKVGAQNSQTTRTPEGGVKINGMQQILEMLRVADPTFRESLLSRIAQQDKRLAMLLRAKI